MTQNEQRTKYLVPSTLGIGLVDGYNSIGFDQSLTKPHLRREVCGVLAGLTTDGASHAAHL